MQAFKNFFQGSKPLSSDHTMLPTQQVNVASKLASPSGPSLKVPQ